MTEINLLTHQAKLAGKPAIASASDASPLEQSALPSVADYEKQIRELNRALANERSQNQRLHEISEYDRQLENVIEQPVSAQITAAMLQRNLDCGMVSVMVHSPTEQALVALATTGPNAASIPPNCRHFYSNELTGRAIRAHKTLIRQPNIKEIRPLEIGSQIFHSEMFVPLIFNGQLEGGILLADPAENKFDALDIPFVEIISAHLLDNWDQSRYNQELTALSREAASLSAISEANNLLTRIAEIARSILNNHFVLVASFDQHDWQMRTSGKAPYLFQSIRTSPLQFLSEISRATDPIRIRDTRRDPRTAHLTLDRSELRTMLACPIQNNGEPLGLILAFGKKTGAGFTEREGFLMNLLAIHAATALERCLLDQEVRSMLRTTQLLNDLSLRITEAEDLNTAAQAIARTAFRIFQAETCGLVLYSEDKRVEASVHFPLNSDSYDHPLEIIQEVMDTRQIAYQVIDQQYSLIAIPIQTQRRCYGALWLSMTNDNSSSHRPVDEIRILINQSSVALERSILLSETRQQASEISRAYTQLDLSYDQTLLALTKALDARDHETELHTLRVTRIALTIGRQIGLPSADLKALKRGAILHDIGKVGISDTILLKKGALDSAEWEIMRRHSLIGGQIIQVVTELHDALPVVVNHHERWDGSGYPHGLRAEEIPLLARIFAVADVYDALTNDRPYRPQKYTPEEALNYLQSQAEILFDPKIVRIFTRIFPQLNFTEPLEE
ncbi:MAG: HD domain-containing protein [Anaerolineaceae bacterium]|nr:HD domain-containing protein [Anaerolineaceae bacterium]